MDDDPLAAVRRQLDARLGQQEPDLAACEARVQAAMLAYLNARADGLCHEGAWECALEAMQEAGAGGEL
jgi:hypothetical protein